MIDCARPARKKPENVLLASAFTHLRLRFPFVKALPSCSAGSTGSDSIPRHSRLYCLLPRRILITFAAAIVSISRRIALIPFPKTLLRRSRTSYASQFTFDADPVLFSFFLSQISHPHRLISPPSSDRFNFLAK